MQVVLTKTPASNRFFWQRLLKDFCKKLVESCPASKGEFNALELQTFLTEAKYSTSCSSVYVLKENLRDRLKSLILEVIYYQIPKY